MKFNNYIEAINFVLCDCAMMNIKLYVKYRYRKNIQSIFIYLPDEKNSYLDLLPFDIKVLKLSIVILDNFDTKYISILSNILKEQFDINILKLFIPDENINDNMEDISNIDVESNKIIGIS